MNCKCNIWNGKSVKPNTESCNWIVRLSCHYTVVTSLWVSAFVSADTNCLRYTAQPLPKSRGQRRSLIQCTHCKMESYFFKTRLIYLFCAGGLKHSHRTQLKSIRFSAAAIFDLPGTSFRPGSQVITLSNSVSMKLKKLLWKRFIRPMFKSHQVWWCGVFFIKSSTHLMQSITTIDGKKPRSLTLQSCWWSWHTSVLGHGHCVQRTYKDSEFWFFFRSLGCEVFADLWEQECRQASRQQSPSRGVMASSLLCCRHQLFGKAQQCI